MARHTLILASSPREGGHYAKRAGLRKFSYRVVHSASQVKGVRSADVHILPSFVNSVTRHLILSHLQWARDMDYFYVDPNDLPTLEQLVGYKQAELLGELSDETLESAYAEQAKFDHGQWAADRHRDQVLAMSPEDLAQIVDGLDRHDEKLDELAEVAKSPELTKVVNERKAHNAKARTAVKRSAAPAPTTYFD